MLRGVGDDDNLPMDSDIDEDAEDTDLPFDFDDGEDSKINFLDDDYVATWSHSSTVWTRMPLNVLIEYDGFDVSNKDVRIVVGEDEEWGESMVRARNVGQRTQSAKRKKSCGPQPLSQAMMTTRR